MSDDTGKKGGGKFLALVTLIVGLAAGGAGGYMVKGSSVEKGVKQAAERGDISLANLKAKWEEGGWDAVKSSFEAQPELGSKILLLELAKKDEQVLSTVRRRAANGLSAGEARFLLQHLPTEATAPKQDEAKKTEAE